MATLYSQQSNNVRKTWFLMILFCIIVIGIGWFLSYYYQNPNILYLLVMFSIGMNIFSYWYSDKIVLKMAGAVEAKREQYFDLYTSVENLAITAGLPMPKVYVISDPAPNAFATGRNEKHAVVAVTTGLLSILEKNELEGVIAHELAHIKNKDILLSTIVVVLVGFIAIVSDMITRSMIFGGMSSRDDDNRGSGIIVLVGIVLSILAPLVAVLIQLAISRKREYLADATGALLTRYPEGLASALKKISEYALPLKRASDATAHLYISNPFGSKVLKGMHTLFMTHPPTEKRIQALLIK